MENNLKKQQCFYPHPDGGLEIGEHCWGKDGYCGICGEQNPIYKHLSEIKHRAKSTSPYNDFAAHASSDIHWLINTLEEVLRITKKKDRQ